MINGYEYRYKSKMSLLVCCKKSEKATDVGSLSAVYLSDIMIIMSYLI